VAQLDVISPAIAFAIRATRHLVIASATRRP
jgi:hypothetical protein